MQEKLLLHNEKSHTCVVNQVNLTRLFEKSREKYGLWSKKNKKKYGIGCDSTRSRPIQAVFMTSLRRRCCRRGRPAGCRSRRSRNQFSHNNDLLFGHNDTVITPGLVRRFRVMLFHVMMLRLRFFLRGTAGGILFVFTFTLTTSFSCGKSQCEHTCEDNG